MLQNVTECYKMLQNVTKCYKMLQNVTKSYRMLQNVTKCYKMRTHTALCGIKKIGEFFCPSLGRIYIPFRHPGVPIL